MTAAVVSPSVLIDHKVAAFATSCRSRSCWLAYAARAEVIALLCCVQCLAAPTYSHREAAQILLTHSTVALRLREFSALYTEQATVIPEPVIEVLCAVSYADWASVLLLPVSTLYGGALRACLCLHHPSDSFMSLATIAESR